MRSNSDGIELEFSTEFSAYDRLPKEVRHALANAPYKLCAYELKKLRWPKDKMLKGIERAIEKARQSS